MFSAPSLITQLGITFLPQDDAAKASGTVEAVMPCNERTCQPFGFMSGGAMLALEETLAGYGSVLRLPENMKPVGGSVMASHVAAKAKGGQVRGRGTLIHEGKTTHLWNVDVFDMETGRLLSTGRILNHIIPCTDSFSFFLLTGASSALQDAHKG